MSNEQGSSTQADLFEAIERESTLANRVTHQIETLILEGRLKPGDRLLSERELARQFDVSRTVIREAVRSLVAKHLLEVRPGSGTLVRSPTTESVAQSMTLLLSAGQTEVGFEKVIEVRRLLEVEIAGLAAERRTPEDLAALDEAWQEMSQLPSDRDLFAKSDVAFHAALARATHNELFSVLLDSIADVMIRVRQMAFDVPGTLDRASEHHRAILEEVRKGDSEGARHAMREHMIEAEETMRQALALHRSD